MAEGYHPPLEEYLEAVHELHEEGVPVIQARLVERLGHSAPAVSEMVRRLADDGFLTVAGRVISLTDAGTAKAESVVRKHRLAERLLTDVIGLPWENAHLEAGRWEHVISDDVEARLVELLGHPTTCPHGNPIPGTTPTSEALTALGSATTGSQVRLRRVTEQVEIDSDALAFLAGAGFVPGVVATVTSRGDDGAVVLDLDGREVSLPPGLASRLFVAAA
ncbi:MAG TPA: metal-dependent transcriptional regulator [Acidimicrobiales bacterium]|nr:metal-dependent transcriptional regulator [Acidimicrobiales bacterium]